MGKFPGQLQIPQYVFSSRKNRSKQILKAAKIGIAFRVFVIILEFFGVSLINSSALFVDALSSLADVASSFFLIFCIKLAQRPPDREHPFGHGRYEPIGGMLLGLILLVLGGVMIIQQLLGMLHPDIEKHIHPLSWLFPAMAMVILEIAYRIMNQIAKKEHSPALAADAIHYRIDSLTSLFATVALMIASIWPAWSIMIDQSGAIMIALFMIGIGLTASRENFNQLMDRTPEDKFFDVVKQAAINTRGVEATEKIRIQQYGPDAHVDIDIEVHPSLTVAKAHRISQKVRLEIQKAWPAVRDVTVHIEPYYANDH